MRKVLSAFFLIIGFSIVGIGIKIYPEFGAGVIVEVLKKVFKDAGVQAEDIF